jgi:hypothetical protein
MFLVTPLNKFKIMKKIIFATFLAFVVGNSSCKEEVPCGSMADNPQATTPVPNIIRSEFHFFIKIMPEGKYIYYPQGIKIYNEQQTLIKMDTDEIRKNAEDRGFGVIGNMIFTNLSFGANVPTSHVLYVKLGNKTDTLRFDTKVKSFCTWDSVAYFRITQNGKLIKEVLNSTSYEMNRQIFLHK